MAMNKVPTLVIGIGGIGCKIAAGISQLLSKEDKKYVGIIGMDTNVNDLSELKKLDIRSIQTSDGRTVRDFLNEEGNKKYRAWFPVSRFLVDRGMLNGAGQVRSISRLAAIAAEQSGRFSPIDQEIKRIQVNDGGENRGTLTVMVVGSITGGTGAGLFLQLPFYIRSLLKHNEGLDSIIIRGMFMGPDITASVQPSKINRDAVYTNAYACLKELNAFYMTQVDKTVQDRLELDWYEKEVSREKRVKKQTPVDFLEDDDAILGSSELPEDEDTLSAQGATIPYDYLYLIEGTGAGEAALENLESKISRMVYTLMFSPVNKDALSVEDNFVLHSMAEGGMNRYAGAGICRLIYPCDLAKEYVTLRTVGNLVRGEWLLLDKQYEDEVRTVLSLQASDSSVEIPRIEESYTKLFSENIKGNGALGKLRKEVYDEDSRGQLISKAAGLRGLIDAAVGEIMRSPEVAAAQTACELDMAEMSTVDTADSEIEKIYKALKDYRTKAENIVGKSSVGIANSIFPPTVEALNADRNKKSFVNLLSGIHPVSARFICYDAILRLEKELERLEKESGEINLDAYLKDEDFDLSTPDPDTADVALKNAIANQNAMKEMLSGLGVNVYKKLLRQIRTKLYEVAEVQRDNISNYLSTNLKIGVYRIVLKRMRMLAENYAIFFQGIHKLMEENQNRITALEDIKMPIGQLGVYCSKEAFRNMALAYRSLGETELPDATKQAVFKELFAVMSDDLIKENVEMTESVRQAREKSRNDRLKSVFDTAVVDTIRTNVTKKGMGIVDMSIRQALEKQYALRADSKPEDDPAYKEEVRAYIREQIKTARTAAEPMLSVRKAEKTETSYLALNPECAEEQEGKPSAGATKENYVPASENGVNTTVLLDEEFSRYELVCMRAQYNYLIEDLAKYAPGTPSEKAYRTRIGDLGKNPENEGQADAFLTVVNPHLNRYWHEEGFIPSIYAAQREKDKKNCIKAFIAGLGRNMFKLVVDDTGLEKRKLWVAVTGSGLMPVRKCNRLIGNRFVDLYESIAFNGKLKEYILGMDAADTKKRKGYNNAQELFEKVLEDPYIQDLCQMACSTAEESDRNILDIFLEMRDGMEEGEWKKLFDGLQITLWEYFAELFDESEEKVNRAGVNVLKMIYVYSQVGKKDAKKEELTMRESALKEQVGILLKNRYRN